nr:bifunctional protein NCOAT [Hymenolepis microstoma]
MSGFFSSDNPERPEVSDFFCGVVEGFYGRPWTYSQRRELFKRMQSMGLNAYLYAPKDEVKHRLSWRQPYNEKEAEHMRSLIAAARDHNICFIFAISPGNDISFSDEADAKALQVRLEQDAFGSPARAQAALTNKVYEALGRPDVFLFCPTEYCASRALPNVLSSSYLSTLGTDLAEGIYVMWTGPLIVSKRISTLSIRDVSRLLKRSIVLWDNLHANDYDVRRVYLGPYAGRPLALRRRRLLRGVLTNPNCEFEVNYVAIHTLAQWAQIGHPTQTEKVAASSNLTDTSDDLEREEKEEETQANEEIASVEGHGPSTPSIPLYRPREALHNALRDWLALMVQDQRSTSVLAKQSSLHLSSPTPMDTDSTDTSETPMQIENDELTGIKTEVDYSIVPEFPTTVVPSLGISLNDLLLLSDLFYLPFSHGPKALKALELGHWLRENAHLAPGNKFSERENNPWCKKYAELLEIANSVSDLREKFQRLPHPGVVCDLAPYLTDINSTFTLLLDYFRWLESGVMVHRTQNHLKCYSSGYSEVAMSGDCEPSRFRGGLITELQRILPLESAQDLFPGPIRVGPTTTTTSTDQSIALEELPSEPQPVQTPTLENMRLSNARTSLQSRRHYTLRPYRHEDKAKVYALWRRILMHRLGLPQDALPEKYKDLPGDRYLLVYLALFPEFGLVMEGPPLFSETTRSTNSETSQSSNKEQMDIVGFAFAAPDLVSMTQFRDNLRREVLRTKYPRDGILQLWDGENEKQESILREFSSTNKASPQISIERFIKMALDWIYDDSIAWVPPSIIAESVFVDAPPPERLDTAISEQQKQQHKSEHQQQTMTTSKESSELTESTGEGSEKSSDEKASLSSFEKDTNNSSHGSSSSQEKFGSDETEMIDCSTSSTITQISTSSISVVGNSVSPKKCEEMKHGSVPAIMAHPASIFVELDDTEFGGTPLATAPSQSGNGGGMSFLGCDSPEMVLDEVARRLFICLLAGLKTCASHGVHVELDRINETRAELYKSFNFYPVTAATTNFVTVLGRLI